MLREELYRAIHNRSFLLALVLGIVALWYGFISSNPWPPPKYLLLGEHPLENNAYDTWLFAFSGPWGLIAPLIAVLPFADSLVVDRTQGYLRHVLVRNSHRRYLLAKFLANLLAGGLAIALPMLLLFVFTSLQYPRGLPPLDHARTFVSGPLAHIYRIAPDLYVLFRVGLGFLFGAIYATLGLAISFLVKNRYLVLATPFLLYTIANFALAVLGLARWTPPVTVIPSGVTTTSSLTVFGELGGIFLASIVCLLLLARKNRLYA